MPALGRTDVNVTGDIIFAYGVFDYLTLPMNILLITRDTIELLGYTILAEVVLNEGRSGLLNPFRAPKSLPILTSSKL